MYSLKEDIKVLDEKKRAAVFECKNSQIKFSYSNYCSKR